MTAEWPVGRRVARRMTVQLKGSGKLIECVGKDALETVSEFCLQHVRALPLYRKISYNPM